MNPALAIPDAIRQAGTRTTLSPTGADPRLSAFNRFSGFTPHNETSMRAPEVDDGRFKAVIAAWEEFVKRPHGMAAKPKDMFRVEWMYREAKSLVKGLCHSSRDVASFSLILHEYETASAFRHEIDRFQKKSGLFLNALMNTCPDEGFEISTERLQHPPDFLCLWNSKHVIIHGNAGDSFCQQMRDGSAVLDGDCQDNACAYLTGGDVLIKGGSGAYLCNEMEGGNVVVEKGTFDYCGWSMSGGTLRIKGMVEGEVGMGMNGGTIYADGAYGLSIGNTITGGRIIHHGKQVWPEDSQPSWLGRIWPK